MLPSFKFRGRLRFIHFKFYLTLVTKSLILLQVMNHWRCFIEIYMELTSF
jgi:hypothetical protein